MDNFLIFFIVLALLFGLYGTFRFFAWQVRLQSEQDRARRMVNDLKQRIVRIEEKIGLKNNKPK